MSGKQAKRARQAAAAEQPKSRSASPKVLAIAGGVLGIVAVVIVLVVALGGGDGDKEATSTPTGTAAAAVTKLSGAAEVQSLFKGIPQNATGLGKPTAPVTMVEYLDLQCPFCQQFETQVLPGIVEKYVRTGKVRVEPRLVAFIGPDSVQGRFAAIAAAEQGKGANLTQLLYVNQGDENGGWLNDEMITAAAASIPGLNVKKFDDARGSSAVGSKAAEMDAQSETDQVEGTPTILVGKTGGKLKQVELTSADSAASLEAAIKAAQSS